jgi:exodeoxyribonuclease V alpha subunit
LSERLIEFKCRIIRNIYKSQDYQIYAVEADDNYKLKKGKYGNSVILGNLHDLGEGIEYHVKALEEKGRDGFYQYKVKNIKREKPTSDFTTRLFLSEILTSSQVDEIIQHYPNIIDLVINNRFDEIDTSVLYNIGEYRLEVIKRKIEENFVFAELIEMFQGLLDLKIINKLYEKYPSAQKIKLSVKKDPYECLCSLSRVGFKTADSIILELDKELKNQTNPPFKFDFEIKTSPQRLNAAIQYILTENEANGNTKMAISELQKQIKSLVANCMMHMKDVLSNGKVYYLDKTDKSVAILETYNTEKHIVEMLLRGLNEDNVWDIKDINKYRNIDEDTVLTDEQFSAVNEFIKNNISILNGVAGSGKSMSTKAIIKLLDDNCRSYMLLAPTGRASKVLSGYSGREASTIHRALGYQGKWNYNEDCPKIQKDVVIVDESSMVDIFVMRALLCAIDFNRTKLLIIGDSDQIPSVGAGNILFDLVNSKKIPVTSLTKVFRYGFGGMLTVATQTRQSESFIQSNTEINVIGEDKGYVYLPVLQENIVKQLITIYKKLLEKNTPEDILILTAYNTGNYGTVAINNHIQKIANKNATTDIERVIKVNNTSFYEDDMVIQIVNNYKAFIYHDGQEYYDDKIDEKVFIPNGEIGKIYKIDRFFKNNQQYMVVDYDGQFIIYTYQDVIEQLKLAYSISIHKSQGGNCKNIILITPKAHTFMLNANLMYVGQTRATQKVFHLGEPDTFNRAVKKKANFNRQTFMQQLMNNPKDLDLKPMVKTQNNNIETIF